MADRLDGTVALVTGASSGIGVTTALELARHGAAVALAARRVERLDELATLEQIHVKHVGRLPDFPQNVIRGVNRVADGPLIEQLHAMRNLCRRWLDFGSTNHARRKARAELRLFNDDRKGRDREGHDFSRAARAAGGRGFSR